MSVKVKGNVIRARRTFVVEEFSERAWQTVLEALPEEDREILSGELSATEWHEFAINERLDAAIVEVLGHGDMKIFEIIGAWSAKLNLTGRQRAFVSHGDPAILMQNTRVIYDYYYDVGKRRWEATSPTSGVMTTYNAKTFSEPDCLTVIGWYKEALGMCGAKNVQIEEVKCRARGDDVCQYEFSWETGSER
jgi:hypothetical protein